MEDQGKRLLIAVAIAFGIMLVWQFVFPSKKKPAEQPDKTASTEASKEIDAASGQTKPDAPVAPPDEATATAPATAERGEEKLFELEFERYRAVFTSWGGALKSIQLKGKQFYDAETSSQLELVRSTPEEGLPLTVSFVGSTFDVPPAAEWVGERISETEVKFRWESTDLRVEKHFKLHPDAYLIELAVDVTKLAAGEAKQQLAVSMYGYEDPARAISGSMGKIPRVWKSACMVGDDVKTYSAKAVIKQHREVTGKVRWAGFMHSYFLIGAAVDPAREPTMTCKVTPIEGGRTGAMRADLVFPSFSFKEGDAVYRRQVFAYMGPKFLDLLESIPGEVGIDGGSGLEEAVDFGWFSVISRPLLWLLKLFQSFVINWGIAIVMLTFLVKLATLYWTHKSMKSMKEMAKLRPKMEAIREKYADDKERQNLETMNLFKTHGVNPLSGCLPMLLQMPIWFALYRMLMTAAELYQAPFIPGWIDDLTRADPYFVLPILLTGMMFVQSKLTPVTQTGMQQKMLQYGMPLMFGVFSFFFPAGLTLYILTNVCLTALHHLVIHREGRAEAKLAKVKTSGKAAAAGVASTRAESEDEEEAETSEGDDADDDGREDAAGNGDETDGPTGSASDADSAKKGRAPPRKKRKKSKRKR